MIFHEVEGNTEEWYALRAGIPTASAFSNVVTSTKDSKIVGGKKNKETGEVEGGTLHEFYKPSTSLSDYACKLAADSIAGQPTESFAGNKWTERGHENEPLAIARYEFVRDVEVTNGGFITNDEGTIGCSCDGLVGEDGLVEVKSLSGKEHVKTVDKYLRDSKCPSKYFAQVQGQLWLTGRKWNDLYLDHPLLPSVAIRVGPDPVFFASLEENLEKLLNKRDLIISSINEHLVAA